MRTGNVDLQSHFHDCVTLRQGETGGARFGEYNNLGIFGTSQDATEGGICRVTPSATETADRGASRGQLQGGSRGGVNPFTIVVFAVGVLLIVNVGTCVTIPTLFCPRRVCDPNLGLTGQHVTPLRQRCGSFPKVYESQGLLVSMRNAQFKGYLKGVVPR